MYLFKDISGNIIYIGKSKNLRKRVSSYFKKTDSTKTMELVKKIADAEFIVVDSELEALLLENRLIKTHKPKYNISLKDSGTYPYIRITDEKFPRIITTRSTKEKGIYFGPYVDSVLKNDLLSIANKSFGIRTCRRIPKRECLNYHIGLCCAPCIKKVGEEEYSGRIRQSKEFLEGNHENLKQSLQEHMMAASKEMKYEIALEKKMQIDAINRANQRQRIENVKDFDQDVIAFAKDGEKFIFGIFYVRKGLITNRKDFFINPSFEETDAEVFENFVKTYYSRNEIPSEIIVSKKFWKDEKSKYVLQSYLTKLRNGSMKLIFPESGERLGLMNLAKSNAELRIENNVLSEIKKILDLPDIPRIIECFDVSNLGKDYIVGAMTRFVDGEKEKKGYRKFEIKGFSGFNDDYAAIKEIVGRRYARISFEKGKFPNLIIIDGGPGQLGSACEAMESMGLKIPVISIAKRNEEIFIPGKKLPLKFHKNSRMMLLIRAIRDETHRFAISYNRKKRAMRFREETN